MDYEKLDEIGMELADAVAECMHAHALEFAQQELAAILEARGISIDDVELDDQMIIESVAENNWMYSI